MMGSKVIGKVYENERNPQARFRCLWLLSEEDDELEEDFDDDNDGWENGDDDDSDWTSPQTIFFIICAVIF